jgi:dipeptide/tripeptide permease
MAYYGVASNLVMYLTTRLHQGTVDAANNVTNWAGTVFLAPLVGAFVADAYLGRYWTFVAGSAVYLLVVGRHDLIVRTSVVLSLAVCCMDGGVRKCDVDCGVRPLLLSSFFFFEKTILTLVISSNTDTHTHTIVVTVHGPRDSALGLCG